MTRCLWCDEQLRGQARSDRLYCDSTCRAEASSWRVAHAAFWVMLAGVRRHRVWKTPRGFTTAATAGSAAKPSPTY